MKDCATVRSKIARVTDTQTTGPLQTLHRKMVFHTCRPGRYSWSQMGGQTLTLFLVFKNYICGVCMRAVRACVCACMHVCEWAHNLWHKCGAIGQTAELALSFCHVGPSGQTRVIRLSKHIYPLSLYQFTLLKLLTLPVLIQGLSSSSFGSSRSLLTGY